MKIKFTKLLALTLCVFMLLSSMTCLSVLAEESEEEAGEPEAWEDIWKEVKQPAYTTTMFTSVKERIEGSGHVEPMQLFAVIEGYAFYGDPLTGEMIFLVLEDKTLTKEAIDTMVSEGGFPKYVAYYCTNPYNAGGASGKGQTKPTDASEKEKILSQIIIKFTENDKDAQLSSFTDGASNQQIVVKNIRGGVRVEYTIGREQVIYLVPRLIRKEKLEDLREQISLNSLSARDSRTFMSYYTLYDLNAPNISEKSKAEIEKNYPITKQFAVYACDSTTTTQELLRLEKLVKSYTNYDYDTLEADHAETEFVADDKVPPLFKLALEYRVDGKEITIRCNAGNIRFDSSVYKLSDVLVLPYGGAGDVATKNGYLFSPDGSGSIIDFSDLNEQFTNSNNLYGQDFAYHTITGQNREVARLPVFGVYQSKKDEKVEISDDEDNTEILEENTDPFETAYLAVIEKGDSLAKINLTYGGPVHSYASIYTSFNPRPKDSYVLDGGISAGTDAMWTVESKRKYTGDFQIRLFILDGTEDGDKANQVYGAEKSYSDMAAAYREYLVRTGVLTKVEDLEEDIPLYLETLGALESTKTVFGVPVDTMLALTSFQDTIDILEQLRGKDITNVKVKMNSWYNGGIMSDIATSIEVEEILGGEEGLKNLIKYANDNKVTLFPDIELSVAYRDNAFDSFDSSDDLAQTIDERPASMKEYDPVLQAFNETSGGILSPIFIKKLYEMAYEDYAEYNVGAISIGNIGKYLSSDFNNDNPLTREDSKELTIQLLQKITENNKKVLVTAGNLYTLPYATDILEVPLDDSRLLYSYATVPFMSMVLHGYKEYTGTPLNLAGDYNYHLLKTIESGASPYFVIAANNTSELKRYTTSNIAKYYSVRYSIWKNDIIEAYNVVNTAVSDVQDSVLLKHDILTDDGKVAKVTYANGITFYINYGEKVYEVEDTEIKVPVGGYVKLDSAGNIINVWEGVE